jgi:hypothetical protein
MHFLSYCYYVKTFHNVNTCSVILQHKTISLEFNGKMMLPATTTSLGLHIKCQIFCLILNKLRISLHIFLSFPILIFIKINPVGDEVICADTKGEVSSAGNDLQHEVLGVTYTACRLKECSHHIACPNVQVVLRILSSSKQHLSS